MRQFLGGVLIFAVVLAACLGSLGALEARSAAVAEAIAQAQMQAAQGDLDGAARSAREAEALWRRHAGFLDTILSHEATDEIERTFAELGVRAAAGEQSEFLAACARLGAMVRRLTEMERVAWRNIF